MIQRERTPFRTHPSLRRQFRGRSGWEPSTTRRPALHPDRRSARIPATISVDFGPALSVVIVNLSKGGCRVEPTPDLPIARAFVLRVFGWPELADRTPWSNGGRTGCIFDPRPDAALYERMHARTTSDERAFATKSGF